MAQNYFPRENRLIFSINHKCNNTWQSAWMKFAVIGASYISPSTRELKSKSNRADKILYVHLTAIKQASK